MTDQPAPFSNIFSGFTPPSFPIYEPSLKRFCKTLIFGPYGSGKTTFLGSAGLDPRTSPMLYLNFEGGESSLAGAPGVISVDIEDWDRYYEVLEYLEKSDHPFKSVGLDSISESHVFALFAILDQEASKRKNPDHLEIGDYGTASVQLRRLIRSFRDLKLHVFLSALAKDEVEPKEGLVTKPLLSGKLADEIPGIVDVVGYLVETTLEGTPPQNVRALLLRDYPKIRVKVRVPVGMALQIPPALINPQVSDLLNILQIPQI